MNGRDDSCAVPSAADCHASTHKTRPTAVSVAADVRRISLTVFDIDWALGKLQTLGSQRSAQALSDLNSTKQQTADEGSCYFKMF